MKIFTQIKTLALVAGMMFATNASATIVSSKVSSGDLVISKVFYSASKKASGSGNYTFDQYVEIYNQRDEDVEIQGMYLALFETENKTSAYTIANLETDPDVKSALSGKLVVKQIFQIPGDKTYTIGAGKSIIICNSAIDHTSLATVGHDLSGADFEVKTTNANYPHNEAVPAMNLIYSAFSAVDYMQFVASGLSSAGVMLLKNNASSIVTAEDKLVTPFGKPTSTTRYALANLYYSIDVVEIIGNNKTSGIDATLKRVNDTYDKGMASTIGTGGGIGETVYRKTAFVMPDGRKVLYDTNNSTTDFTSNTTIQPRAFDEEASGLTENTITIPESGYVLFQPEKSFYGTDDVVFTYITTTVKDHDDITYNECRGKTDLIDKSNFIAISKPGTYKIWYSDAQPTRKITTNAITYATEDNIELTGSKKTRSIYTFYTNSEKTGFQRVENSGTPESPLYNKADFTGKEGVNRLYLELVPNAVSAFYEANGAASAAEFDNIVWHGTTPAKIITDIKGLNPTAVKGQQPKTNGIYDLGGHRVNLMQKGNVYIIDGKKVLK